MICLYPDQIMNKIRLGFYFQSIIKITTQYYSLILLKYFYFCLPLFCTFNFIKIKSR